MQRGIRGSANPVENGDSLTTRDLDWQHISFLVLHACVFQVYDGYIHARPCLSRYVVFNVEMKNSALDILMS